jgi:hypothetical protein
MSNQLQGIAFRAFKAVQSTATSLPNGVMAWTLAAFVSSGILFWRFTPDVETVLPRIICAVALLAAIRFARGTGSYFWVAGFSAIAVLFNPFVPGMLSRIVVSGIYLVCAATALACLAMLEIAPRKPALALMPLSPRSGSKAA